MATKRKGRKLSPSQRRVYLSGVRRGKVLAAAALTRKRKAAARKGAETREKKPKRKPVIGEAVPELVLYEASADEAAPAFVPLPEWPVSPAEYVASLQIILEGRVVEETDVPIPAEWEAEAVGKTIRRQLRAWYDTWQSEHPERKESPQVAVARLVLRATLV